METPAVFSSLAIHALKNSGLSTWKALSGLKVGTTLVLRSEAAMRS
jgi:hypothetical protein